MQKAVTTSTRLDRTTRRFTLLPSAARKFVRDSSEGPSVARISCDAWRESSTGDSLHKLILVISGQLDVEGDSGGWLVLPNHMIFIPAGRPFNLRTSPSTVAHVAFLDPGDREWHHHGCWVTVAEPLAHELLSTTLRIGSRPSPDHHMLRQLCRTLSNLCQEWFSNPRMLWLPAAQSKPTRDFVREVAAHLSEATVKSACAACGVSQRTLQRLSREEFSFGLKTLIMEIRMMRAMELLVDGSLSVDAVGREVGYSSVSAFTTAFTRRVGLSPGDYRHKNRASLGACMPASSQPTAWAGT